MSFGTSRQELFASRLPRTLQVKTLPSLCVGLVALFFYTQHLPSAVQSLDTGELVLAAWGLYVPHPPGYPLFVWLAALAIHLLPWGSVFWRASLLSACWASFVLATLYQRTPQRLLGLVFIVAPLATHPIFWRYALLPDVFMLNVALMCSLFVLTKRRPTRPWHLYRIAALFGLGLSNHQTFIFLTPIVGWYILALNCKKRSRIAVQAGVLSCVICALAYSSLFFLHPDDLASWGQLHSLSDLMGHILRLDYGTFQLSARTIPAEGLKHSAQAIWQIIGVMPFSGLCLIYAPLSLWPHRYTHGAQRIYIIWLSLLGYILCFLPLTNTTHHGVLERFYLMPLVWASIIAVDAIPRLSDKPHTSWRAQPTSIFLAVVSIVSIVVQYRRHHVPLNLSCETIVEDYALNALHTITSGRPAMLIVHGDTRWHAIRYVQRVMGVAKDAVVISRTALMPKTADKWANRQPRLRLPKFAPQIDEARYVSTLFALNHATFDVFVSDLRGIDTADLRVMFVGPVRQIAPGSGLNVDWPSVQKMQRRSNPARLIDPHIFQEEFDLFAAYAYPYLAAALAESDVCKARDFLRSALLLVPYCLPAHYELCLREPSTQESVCHARLLRLRALVGDYF